MPFKLGARITEGPVQYRIVLLFVSVCFFVCPVTAFADAFGQLKGKQYGSGSDVLIILLHGDISRGGAADYLYPVARTLAASNSNVTAVALLRPGYFDSKGNKSAGSNHGKRDQYTKRNNDLVAQSIQALIGSLKPRHVVVLGHSGGAAQLGAIIGRYPNLVDSAVLVSCPCDIGRWRQQKRRSAWSRSQSPIRYVKSIGRNTRVIVMTGANDDNTSPALGAAYVEAAQSAGVAARFVRVPDATHSFVTLRSAVIAMLLSEAGR